MTVTQDYKILTLTIGESNVVKQALKARGELLLQRIEFFGGMDGYTSLLKELKAELADVQSALAKEPATRRHEPFTVNMDEMLERWRATRADFLDRAGQAGQEAGQNEKGVRGDAALSQYGFNFLDSCNQLIKLFVAMNEVRNQATDGLGGGENIALDTVSLCAQSYLQKLETVA